MMEYEGYMTVEASVIMPIVLIVCCFIIYIGFYQYDRCVSEQDAYRAALRGANLYGADKEEKYRAVQKTLEELATNHYAAARCSYKVSVKDKMYVKMEGTISIPLRGLARMVGTGVWDMEKEVESRMTDPVFFIRSCKLLGIEEDK